MQSWYSTDTLQTRKPFCHSFRIRLQIQSRYAPDTDSILSLILIIRSRHGCYSFVFSHYKSPDTVQIRSRHESHSDTYSSDLQLTIQQTFLDGIYKPISNKIQPLFHHFFTMMQFDSKKTSNMKVVVLHEIYNFSSQISYKRYWISSYEFVNIGPWTK